MLKRLFLPAAILLACFGAGADNFCMDCYQRQIQRTRPDGSIWYESDGECCPSTCFGFAGYTIKDVDKGAGCSTAPGDGTFIVGDYCNSSDWDAGCPNAEEPLPIVTPKPKYQDPGTDPDDGPESPILIDMSGNGYRLTSASSGVHFDIRGDANPVQIAWTSLGAENAFLAVDRNGNGGIDSGAELFGNHTRLRSGAVAANGYIALAELDANHDGIVDARDPGWSNLVLWTDRNHDGVSGEDEVQSIANSTITALETEHRRVGRRDQWGNEFRYIAHVRIGDARRPYYDVFLRTE